MRSVDASAAARTNAKVPLDTGTLLPTGKRAGSKDARRRGSAVSCVGWWPRWVAFSAKRGTVGSDARAARSERANCRKIHTMHGDTSLRFLDLRSYFKTFVGVWREGRFVLVTLHVQVVLVALCTRWHTVARQTNSKQRVYNNLSTVPQSYTLKYIYYRPI